VAAVNSMLAVADELKRQERCAEELILRQQIVEALRRNLGLDNYDTVKSEARLGTCLLDLDRAGDAEPFLTHVVAEIEKFPGTMSQETFDAITRMAVVRQDAGRSEEACELLELALSEFVLQGQGECTPAMEVSVLLGAILFKLDELEEATLLNRHILDVRARTLGPDDPQTLESLEFLIRVLKRTNQLAEARVMAISLLERRTKMLGAGHADTAAAQELSDSLNPPDETFSE
jgi:tetratricopeptide (TPR) repeat protein